MRSRELPDSFRTNVNFRAFSGFLQGRCSAGAGMRGHRGPHGGDITAGTQAR
jgi:hypothetical protein